MMSLVCDFLLRKLRLALSDLGSLEQKTISEALLHSEKLPMTTQFSLRGGETFAQPLCSLYGVMTNGTELR